MESCDNLFISKMLNQCYTNSILQAYSLFFKKYIKGRFQKKKINSVSFFFFF
jgi:hypothetical protein